MATTTLQEHTPDSPNAFVAWVVGLLTAVDRRASDAPLIRAVVELIEPIRVATSNEAVTHALNGARDRYPEFLRLWACHTPASLPDAATQRRCIREALDASGADLAEDEVVAEVVALQSALFELTQRALAAEGVNLREEILATSPAEARERLAVRGARDAVLAEIALLCLAVAGHQTERWAAWQRRLLLNTACRHLQNALFFCPVRGGAGLRDFVELARRAGLAPRDPSVVARIDRALAVPSDQAGSLRTLRARAAADRGLFFYFGDCRFTAEHLGLLGGLEGRVEALERYERGTAPLVAVAEAFGVRTEDAVVLLEQVHSARAPEAILLTDERRAEIDARLRADRAARRGKPIPSPEAVAREVIASQRIEGIDARAFVRSERGRG